VHVLVAGAGWLGSAVARALLARGDRVTAVRRDPAKLAPLVEAGAGALPLDLSEPGSSGRIPGGPEAIVACQSGADGVEGYRRAYLDANRTLLEAARRLGVRTFVYTGSTGVFGQRDESWVDESTPPAPAGPAARVLVEAEERVRGGEGVAGSVLRLSGIYGPGRSWLVDRVRAGALAVGPGDEAFMNFCHLEDAVAAVLAVLDRGRPGAVYHASDGLPTRRREVVRWLAGALGVPVPEIASPPSAEGPNRRISAVRTRRELGLELAYPSFREGVRSELGGQRGAGGER